jgi:hypothetical protein
MSAGRNPALEARCYMSGTLLHHLANRWSVRLPQRKL